MIILLVFISITILVLIISMIYFSSINTPKSKSVLASQLNLNNENVSLEPFGVVRSSTDATQSVVPITNIGNQIIIYLRESIFRSIDKPNNIAAAHIERFPEYIDLSPTEIGIFKSLPEEVWTGIIPGVAIWSYTAWPDNIKKYYMTYWRTCGPILRRLFDKVLPKTTIPINPVVHFRCSDIPFNRHPNYHLPTNDMVEWTCKILRERGYNSITLLQCNTHFSNQENQKQCELFLEHYINIYKKNRINVSFQCKSILEDFAAMVYCPLLVSLNASSYAFVAGMSRDPNTFVSGNNIREAEERPEGYIGTKDSDWLQYQNPPILHKNVKDYLKLKL